MKPNSFIQLSITLPQSPNKGIEIADIKYLTNKEIDKTKWDKCINDSNNGLIYARSLYLDSMAANWDALVMGDYEVVMPLTWRKKYGIQYLYQPAFIQQGGVFSKKEINDSLIQAFINKAFSHFKFAEITLNYLNSNLPTSLSIVTRISNNYILNLNQPYEEAYLKYRPAFTKSLRRIKKFELIYRASVNYREVIKLYQNLYSKRFPHLKQKDLMHFENMCTLLDVNNVITRIVYNNEKEIVAAVLLLKDEKRLYNLISCITPEGKKLEANYFLFDRLINEFSNQNFLLDFEGSDIAGIENFYKKFNPENQPYFHIRHNNLNPVLKLIKP